MLAARGWDSDPDRRAILRTLFAEELPRAYLWSYARLRHRDKALEQTRSALLSLARSLDHFPKGCTFSVWTFLTLKEERRPRLHRGLPSGCPEAWRILSDRELDDAQRAHRNSCPSCQALLEEYRTFLTQPDDVALVDRAGWVRAQEDLQHFLLAAFGDRRVPVTGGKNLGRIFLFRLRRWWPELAPTLVALAALGLSLGLSLENRRLEREVAQWRLDPDRSDGEETSTQASLVPSVPAPGAVIGAMGKREGETLVFGWRTFPGSKEYRLHFCTAKLDTLYASEPLRAPRCRIRASDLQGYAAGSSYLFKVDAFSGKRLLASSGYVPFREP